MQTAVSDPRSRTEASERLTESSISRAVVQPVFAYRRGRKRLDLSWRFKLAVAASVSALVAVSLLIQA